MRRTLSFTLLMMIAAIGPFSLGMVIAIQHDIGVSVNASLSQMQYILSSSFVVLGVCNLITGRLLDRFGPWLVISISGTLLVMGLLWSAFSQTFESFVLARVLQAGSGSCGFVLVRALVFEYFDNADGPRFLGYLTVITVASPMFAPLIGSYVNSLYGWRILFISVAVITLGLHTYAAVFLSVSIRFRSILVDGGLQSYFLQFDRQLLLSALSISFASAIFFSFVTLGPFSMMRVFGTGSESFAQYYVFTSVGFILGGLIYSRMILRSHALRISRAGVIFNLIGIMGVWGAVGYHSEYFFVFSLMLLNFGNGFLVPAMSAYILSNPSRTPALVSGLLGFVQMIIGGMFSAIAGYLNSSSLVPLVTLMSICVVLAFISLIAVSRLHEAKVERF